MNVVSRSPLRSVCPAVLLVVEIANFQHDSLSYDIAVFLHCLVLFRLYIFESSPSWGKGSKV
jgi:hypothetical protein